MLTPAQWQSYRNVINQAMESFAQDTVTWKRYTRGFQRYGEDDPANEIYTDITLNVLISYNIFRTWPMTDETAAGALDKESIVMILNKDYLQDNGYLNSDGFFDMNPGQDQFIHRGIKYRSAGETEVGQAGNNPLLVYIILTRENTPTATDKY